MVCETAPAVDDSTPEGTTRIARYAPHTVRVEVVADRPAYLVLTDTWYPGWTARLDGGPVRLWRANHAFRLVRVPAGASTVVFRYRPLSVWAGLAVSAGTAGLVLAAAVLRWRGLAGPGWLRPATRSSAPASPPTPGAH